eukprot:15444195-Alexandrium_andersonii.AAC.1
MGCERKPQPSAPELANRMNTMSEIAVYRAGACHCVRVDLSLCSAAVKVCNCCFCRAMSLGLGVRKNSDGEQ